MYLQNLILKNFRSFSQSEIPLCKDLTILVGENNGGKSNAIDAIRLLTAPLGGRRELYCEATDIRFGSDERKFELTATFSAETLAAIIGVNEVTISRIRRGGSALEPGTKPFELAVLFVHLFRSLDAIVGGDEEVAASWLVSPNTNFDAPPIEKLQTVAGLVDVIAYLDTRRALV